MEICPAAISEIIIGMKNGEKNAALDVLTVVDNFLLESVYTSDTNTVDNAYTILVDTLCIDAGILYALNGTGHSQLGVTVHLADLFAVEILLGIETLNLAGEVCLAL